MLTVPCVYCVYFAVAVENNCIPVITDMLMYDVLVILTLTFIILIVNTINVRLF